MSQPRVDHFTQLPRWYSADLQLNWNVGCLNMAIARLTCDVISKNNKIVRNRYRSDAETDIQRVLDGVVFLQRFERYAHHSLQLLE